MIPAKNKLQKMSKLIVLSLFLVLTSNTSFGQFICCPKFKVNVPNICSDSNSCRNSAGGKGLSKACKGTNSTYTVAPNLVGYTYTWTVIGGTITSNTGNPKTITWGTGSNGYFKVVISNGMGCIDSIEYSFCMVDAPKANFSIPDSTCIGSTVSFTNTSTGGSSYFWDFGDGSVYAGGTSSPTHTYTSAGTYIVCMTAYSASSGGTSPIGQECASCQDTKCDTIIVKTGTGPDISMLDCHGSICASTSPTLLFQTSSTCSPLTWTIPAGAGTINNPGGNPVSITWNPAFTGTPTLSLSVPLTCTGGCPASTSFTVPLIYPTLPITGPDPICVASLNTYSVPLLPGSYYSTTLTNTGALASLTGPTFNSNTATVNAGPIAGTFILKFTYYDSIKKCGGVATKTITVKNKFSVTQPAGPICDKDPASICASGNATWVIDSLGITIATATGTCYPLINLFPGVYNITATPTTPALWCNSSANTNILILPNPKLSTSLPLIDTFCAKDIATYTVNSTVPSSTYNWSITGTGNSIMSNDDNTVVVKWNTPGTLSVFQSNPCNSDTITFTSDTFIAPTISGPTTACEDDIVTYTVMPANMPLYLFSADKGSIISQSGNSVSVIWAGSTSGGHQLKVKTCGGTAILNVAVTSAAATSTVIDSIKCTVAYLKCTPAGFGPYLWYRNGTYIISTPTNTYSTTLNGYWSCKPTGCYKKSGANVLIPSPPILNISTPIKKFCSTTGVVAPITFYSALSVGATPTVTYQWYGPSGSNFSTPTALSPSGTSATYTPPSQTFLGLYYLIIKDGAGCIIYSDTIKIDTGCATASGSCTPPPYRVTSISSTCSGGGKTFTANMSSTPPAGTTYLWSYGDGTSGTGNPSNHTYTLPGVYQVCVKISNAAYCDTTACRLDTVTFVPSFTIKPTCSGDSLFNNTQVLAGFSIASFSWNAGAGTTLASTSTNPTFATGNGNITLTVTVGSGASACTNTITLPITTPSSSLAITGLPPSGKACKNDNITGITTTPAPSNYSVFSWNFGDGTTSNMAPTMHAWGNSGGPFTITLITVDNLGCLDTATATIMIDTLPKITLSKDSMICRGDTVMLIPSPTLPSFTWYNSDASLLGAPNIIPGKIVATGMYYVIGTDGNGCKNISNTVTVIVHPLPKIQFKFPNGQVVCKNTVGSSFLQITSTNNVKYIYNWSSDDPTNISFSPSGVYNPFIVVGSSTSYGYHQIYLTVIDTSTGCDKTDTVCILVQRTPSVAIAPAGPICEGASVTLTPTPNMATYTYLWSNGAVTPTITVTNPGFYSVQIDSMGCSSGSNLVLINPKPNTDLFPMGCDTFCDTAHLYIPLPNNIGFPPPPGVYPSIQYWIDGSTLITGPYLMLTSISLGSHTVQVIVSNTYGCYDTSGIYNIFVKDCDSICPPCIKDSCCNDFLDSMKSKTILANYSASPSVTFSPPSGLLATDIVQWDFTCDGIVDMTTAGSSTATYNYFTTGSYFVCVKIMRIIPAQKDTCFVNFTKKIVIESQHIDSPCSYCNNLFANMHITDDCAVTGDRYRTAFATGGSGVFTYKWFDPLFPAVTLATTATYAGPSPCICIIFDQVTGCNDTSGVDWYRDIVKCVANTTADNRCTNFKLTMTKNDGPATGDVILTAYGSGGSGSHSFWWYGNLGSGGPSGPVGPTTAVSYTTPALTSGPTMFMKIKDLSWGCEAIDSFSLADKICRTSSIQSLTKGEIKIFPVPTSSKLYIESPMVYKLQNSTIRIIDIMGRVVIKSEWNLTKTQQEIDLESYPSGIYYLNITNQEDEIIYYQKILKQ